MQRAVLTFAALRRIRRLRLQCPIKEVEQVTAKEMRMEFFKRHKQVFMACLIAAFVLCYPAIWQTYLIDFIVFSWFIHSLISLVQKLFNKGVSHD